MNKDTFLKLIKNPSAISADEIVALESVIKNFPYSATASLLLAKANSDKGSMFSNQSVKRAALFSPERGKLRQLIIGKSTSISSIDEPTELITETLIPNKVIEDLSTVEVIKKDEISSESIEKFPKDELQFLSSPLTISSEDNLKSLSDSILQESEPILEKKTSIESIESEPLKFYVHKNDFGKDIRKVKVDLMSEYLAYRETILPQIVEPDIQKTIIEKFLIESPSIPKPATLASGGPQVDLAKKSTIVDMELVTENLANIYVKQEKFKKAVEVYQKLTLKYPDKSAYFAEKIINLKSFIK